MSSTVLENSGVIYNNSSDCGNIINSRNNEFDICNLSAPDQKRQVLEWLSPLASRERHQAVRDARVDGVGDRLLRTPSFSEWRSSEDRVVKPVLLCYGDPGVGKTYTISLVIDTLCRQVGGDSVAVAYVYCDFSARNVQSASTVLGSVLRQVVGALAEIPDEVQKAFERAKIQVDGCGLRLPEILQMLTKSLTYLKRSFICIDALDEFPLKHQPELWESLQRVIRECPSARLFLTGRPHIRDQAQKYFPGTVGMLPLHPSEHDIGLYLRMRLSRDPEFNAMDEGLRWDILSVIPARISEIFLLVSINMDAILTEPTIRQRRKALQRMTTGRGLQDVYNTTLDRIRQQGGHKARLGMEALMWISRCERPLRSEELCHALGVELGAEDFDIDNVPSLRTVLGCTLGLVAIDEGVSTVRLVHHTLQEYLAEHPTLFVTAHPMMAEICLTYLNSRSVRALPLNLDMAPATAPFLEYATCFWGAHAAREVTQSAKSLALQVLDGYENYLSAAVLWRKKICKWHLEADVQGISGLHCIAFWGIAEIATAILEAKRWDMGSRDSRGDTPLMWAVRYGNDEVVEILLRGEVIRPNVLVRGDHAVFSLAAQWRNEGVVRLLLERGNADPNLSDKGGQTPLSYAAMNGQEGIVKLLQEHTDANSSLSDKEGQSPLSVAAEHRYQRAPKLSSERGSPDRETPETRGRITSSVPGSGTSEQEVTDLLPAPEVITPHSADDLPSDSPASHPAQSGPPPGQPLPFNQSPPNQSDSASAPSISIYFLAPSLAFPLILLLIFQYFTNIA